MQCLQVLLAVEEHLPDTLIQEYSLEDAGDQLEQVLIPVESLNLEYVNDEDNVVTTNLNQVYVPSNR